MNKVPDYSKFDWSRCKQYNYHGRKFKLLFDEYCNSIHVNKGRCLVYRFLTDLRTGDLSTIFRYEKELYDPEGIYKVRDLYIMFLRWCLLTNCCEQFEYDSPQLYDERQFYFLVKEYVPKMVEVKYGYYRFSRPFQRFNPSEINQLKKS